MCLSSDRFIRVCKLRTTVCIFFEYFRLASHTRCYSLTTLFSTNKQIKLIKCSTSFIPDEMENYTLRRNFSEFSHLK